MKFLTKQNLSIFSLLGFIFWMGGSLLGSKIATRAHPINIPSPEKYFSQSVENQTFKSFDHVEISS